MRCKCSLERAYLQVLPTQLIPDEKEGKVLRVRMIQKEGVDLFTPAYLFDEGSTISWIPCGRKLTCSFPGIKFFYGPDTYYGEEVWALAWMWCESTEGCVEWREPISLEACK